MVFIKSTDVRFLNCESPSTELLQLIGVPDALSESVKILDKQDSLVLLHYIAPQDENPETMNKIGHVRGIVVDTQKNVVVCRSAPFTREIVASNHEQLQRYLSNISDFKFTVACEGTVIRVYWAGEKWNVSTHHKIDAGKSYWSSKNNTFGSMFDDCFNNQFSSLNKDYCYAFLMSHPSNRMVYPVDRKQLVLLNVWSISQQCFVECTNNLTGVTVPVVVDVSNIDDLQTMDARTFDNCGRIAINRTTGEMFKITSDFNFAIKEALGNIPSLRTRYIQIRGKPEEDILRKWFYEPEYQSVFDSVETEITVLVNELHNWYINRFVQKDFSPLPKEEFVTIQRCHSWHVMDRTHNIVTNAVVRQTVNTTPSHFLHIMLNRAKKNNKVMV